MQIRPIRVLPLSAFKSNHSPPFGEGQGVRLYLSFGEGLGGEAFFRSIQVHIPFFSVSNEKSPHFLVLFIQNT